MLSRKERAEALLEKAMFLMDVEEKATISVRPLKTTIATIRFSSKGIRITIDPKVLDFPPELQLYVICHELAHYKANTPYHTKAFWDELREVFSDPEAMEEEVLRRVMA